MSKTLTFKVLNAIIYIVKIEKRGDILSGNRTNKSNNRSYTFFGR